jgi:hypothetical protein
MRVPPEVVAEICRQRADDVFVPAETREPVLDRAKLLWAFAGVESTFGLHSNPRHEPSYCYGGHHFDAVATEEWGCLAHCSFGPWQVMFDNFPKGVTPRDLLPIGDGSLSAQLSVRAAIRILNQAFARGAKDLQALALAYNGPKETDLYTKELLASYDRPMVNGQESVSA